MITCGFLFLCFLAIHVSFPPLYPEGFGPHIFGPSISIHRSQVTQCRHAYTNECTLDHLDCNLVCLSFSILFYKSCLGKDGAHNSFMVVVDITSLYPSIWQRIKTIKGFKKGRCMLQAWLEVKPTLMPAIKTLQITTFDSFFTSIMYICMWCKGICWIYFVAWFLIVIFLDIKWLNVSVHMWILVRSPTMVSIDRTY